MRLEDEEEEADEGGPATDVRWEEVSWGVEREGGSLMTAMRKPASVNASLMACSGRCQYVSTAGRPSKRYSSE